MVESSYDDTGLAIQPFEAIGYVADAGYASLRLAFSCVRTTGGAVIVLSLLVVLVANSVSSTKLQVLTLSMPYIVQAVIVERRSRLAITAVLAAFLIAALGSNSDDAAVDAPRTAASILQRAFTNRYGVNLTAELELQIHAATGDPQTRILNAATLQKGNDYYALGQLSAPEYLRGMTLLTISSAGGRLEAFVYLPSLRKSRRIATIHRDDRFLGSDLTYEDFERRYAEDCKSTMLADGMIDGEPVFRIECTPIRPMSYDSAVFSIAKSDWTILSFEEFKGDPRSSIGR